MLHQIWLICKELVLSYILRSTINESGGILKENITIDVNTVNISTNLSPRTARNVAGNTGRCASFFANRLRGIDVF